MASKKRAKRKVDRSEVWRLVWLVAFVGSLLAGLFLSPLTVPTDARVRGAERHLHAAIARELRTLSDAPALRVDTGAVESRLLQTPGIRSASLRTNVFGRMRLTITGREPVAWIDENTVVDESGRTFPLGAKKRPNLQISENVKDFSTIITISDASPLNQLCRVAKKIKESLPKVVGTLEIDDRERIRLRIDGLVVEFGDTSDLDAKVEILSRTLKENPQRVQQGGSINLVAPEDPVQVR